MTITQKMIWLVDWGRRAQFVYQMAVLALATSAGGFVRSYLIAHTHLDPIWRPPLYILAFAFSLLLFASIGRWWPKSAKQGHSLEAPNQPQSRLKIISAHWGVEGALGGDPDKVDCLLEKQTGNIFTARACGDLFHGSIPTDGKLRLKVKYSFDGIEATVVRQDGEFLMLPEDPYLKSRIDLFSPLQLDALVLREKLIKFLAEFGPEPICDTYNCNNDPHLNALALTKYHDAVVPWRSKLKSIYVLNFKEDGVKLYHRLSAAGTTDRHLGTVADTASSLADIQDLIDTLWKVAGQIKT